MNIEFAITLRCNAKCPSCSRHSHLYGEESDITMEQLKRFIEEVKGHGNIYCIWITGGEPTIHPSFIDIIKKLKNELLETDIIDRLIVVSNGVVTIEKELDVESIVLGPQEKIKLFRCQYVAPYDTGQKRIKYPHGCNVPYTDGVGFSVYGWYPCGAGSAICMLFNILKYNREKIPKDINEFGSLEDMCKLCQVSAKKWMYVKDYGDIKSVSFRKAFEKFDKDKLWRY